jgi:hypothetical protein
MEKLIELLNEYWEYDLVEHNWEICKWTTDDETGEINIYTDYTNNIISKKFWFIKWLVENDKIDREKCWFKNEWLSWNWYDSGIAFVQNYDNDTFKVSEFYSPYLQLLMLLSISDTPIEDLISYLK